MIHKISFQQINYFLTAAELLNFTDAAKSLYISQPALSKQIGVLEKELGFPLFHRDRHHVELTPEGASLYQDWKTLSTQLNDSIYNASRISNKAAGSLSIACSDTFDYSDVLPPVVSAFRRNYPHVSVNLESHSFKSLREGLLDEAFDIIFTPYFELENLPDVHWMKIKDIPLSVIIPDSNPLSAKEDLCLSDLRGETFILISPMDSNSGQERTYALSRRLNFPISNAKYVPNVSSMGLAVANGLGIAVCNAKLFENQPSCRIYPLTEHMPEDSFLVAVWKKRRKNIALDLFSSLLYEHFSTQIQ